MLKYTHANDNHTSNARRNTAHKEPPTRAWPRVHPRTIFYRREAR